ncbi:hypothetical protein P8C59_003305 [Phyllachora maydis]|uniref:Centromere protein H C-terminal domain-containing protein n=1 Tax=Phyllachora maydis TaxID=1825666 RepID=A0AAD9I041_9PEZI|nr:hypothetical protein P8C59_003305 [Phyllachora maydis]
MERQEDALELSETELEILHLYDKLQQLRIELSLMRTRQEHAPYDQGPAEEVTEDMLRDAQDELLHARASYSLTNSAIENVLVVNPILRAVHSATEASPVERDLLPATIPVNFIHHLSAACEAAQEPMA